MEMYLILLNLMLYLTLAQAERREGLRGRSQLIGSMFTGILFYGQKGPPDTVMYSIPAAGSGLVAGLRHSAGKRWAGPTRQPLRAGPQARLGKLNKSIALVGDIAWDHHLRGLGRAFCGSHSISSSEYEAKRPLRCLVALSL